MKNYLITSNDRFSTIINLELVNAKNLDQAMTYVYDKYIKDKNYWDLTPENFKSHYENIGKRLENLVNSYAFTKRNDNIEIYDGNKTIMHQVFEVENNLENYAVITETDIFKSYIISQKVYNKIIEEIDNLRILYNEVENTDIVYDNEFDWLSNYESAFFSNELLDYNDFDFISGDIKDVSYVGGSSNTESSLAINKIDHTIINSI